MDRAIPYETAAFLGSDEAKTSKGIDQSAKDGVDMRGEALIRDSFDVIPILLFAAKCRIQYGAYTRRRCPSNYCSEVKAISENL